MAMMTAVMLQARILTLENFPTAMHATRKVDSIVLETYVAELISSSVIASELGLAALNWA